MLNSMGQHFTQHFGSLVLDSTIILSALNIEDSYKTYNYIHCQTLTGNYTEVFTVVSVLTVSHI